MAMLHKSGKQTPERCKYFSRCILPKTGLRAIVVVTAEFEEDEEPMQRKSAKPEHNQEQEQRSLLRILAGTIQHFLG
jgi:hypothetical protein